MTSIKLTCEVNGKKVNVDVPDPGEKIKSWQIKLNQTSQYSKEEVIVKSFNEDFPHIELLGETYKDKFNYVTKLVSRNKKLLVWFLNKKLVYSELAQMPTNFKDLLDPQEYKGLQEDITTVNKIISSGVAKQKKITDDYKEEMRQAQEELDRLVEEKVGSNDVLKILTLSSQSLPLAIVDAIQKYNPAAIDSDFEEKKKLYGRELLIQFKTALLKVIKENEDIIVDDLIDELTLK